MLQKILQGGDFPLFFTCSNAQAPRPPRPSPGAESGLAELGGGVADRSTEGGKTRQRGGKSKLRAVFFFFLKYFDVFSFV